MDKSMWAHLSNTSSGIPLGEHERPSSDPEASCLYALITGRRSVSRRYRASWYLRKLNKTVKCDALDLIEQDGAPKVGQTDEGQDKTQNEVNQQQHIDCQSPPLKNYERDIFLVSVATNSQSPVRGTPSERLQYNPGHIDTNDERFLVTPNTRVLYMSKSVATSIILDLSPSVVSVSPQDNCVFLDSMFDALKRTLHLLVKKHEFPSTQASRQFTLAPTVFVSVIAYTPFVFAKNNQVLIQNRRISSSNIEQVLVELWIFLIRLIQELHDLVTNTCGISYEYEASKTSSSAFVFAPPLTSSIIRHPGSVLDDIYELGLFSTGLMPRLTRLSVIIITDGLFASSNDLSAFRLKSIAVSFVSLANELIYPDACFGYTTYSDLMKFVAKSTQGVHITHSDLIASSCNLARTKQIPLTSNPLFKIFCWSLHSDFKFEDQCATPKVGQDFNRTPSSPTPVVRLENGMRPETIARLFCIDQPVDTFEQTTSATGDRSPDMDFGTNQNYHDWRSFTPMSRNLDADFEQVLACLLREGYLIKSINLKDRETSNISARLVLYWKYNLNLEQELTAPYWNSADPFELSDSSNLILKPFMAPSYGDTFCEVTVHGSYNFLHDFYCDKKVKRRSDYRSIAYQQFEQLIVGVKHTYDRLQYLSRYYRDANLSRVPSFLQHGNSLLFEQPHTHNLISTIENLVDKTPKSREFSDYWQEISHIELRNWKNLMHIHTLRIILEHDQPKHKNLFCQNANGRFTHIQCRRAMSAMSNFIKSYASFALLEDSLYIKFILTKEDDLREIETSATKGFIVIRIKKLLPIVVVYLMFTSGILDSHRVQIVEYIEQQLINCKVRESRASTVQSVNGLVVKSVGVQSENILRSKVIYAQNEACCTLIRSPLERMLRVYSRNMIAEFLSQNLTHGLPGSCPYSVQHKTSASIRQAHQHGQRSEDPPGNQQQQQQQQPKSRVASLRDHLLDDCPIDSNALANNRYNPVFGKYLYGIRVVHTLGGLPYERVHQMVMSVLAKISSILVNVRIKQGFHVAFNNSGLLTLVAELAMRDYSHQFHSSNCLCQYLVFPPTITNSGAHGAGILHAHGGPNNGTPASQMNPLSTGIVGSVGSLSGSLANSDHSYLRNSNDVSSPTKQGYDQGEIKVIREYWIEQQYGVSASSSDYHKSLENLRYSEVVDHLYLTDRTIFDCLLTYDLLQLFCDRMSPFYELDLALARSETRNAQPFSPTTSTNSSSLLDPQFSPTTPSLPSNLLEGTTKDATSRVPLIELEYKFSLVDFLDYCQFASMDVLLFKNESLFYEPPLLDPDGSKMELGRGGKTHLVSETTTGKPEPQGLSQSLTKGSLARKTSVETNALDSDHTRREHRSSYDSINTVSMAQAYTGTILNPSPNHLFLETLHKRLKQIHDKELRVSELDRRKLTEYLNKRKIKLDSEGDPTYSDMVSGSPLDARDHTDQANASGQPAGVTSASSQEPNRPSWRCFMRKGNQENLVIVLIPASLDDVKKWMAIVESNSAHNDAGKSSLEHEVCPIFVFRCSSTMINNQVLAFLHDTCDGKKSEDSECSPTSKGRSNLESDLSLHFGQPCKYIGKLRPLNDELDNEILPLSKFSEMSQGISDEKTLELVHFGSFLRKIKNTVLKSRFSSLNDAYLSELFVHKDDILYYINNVDMDTQKKYHVSSHLRGLADFVRGYEEYYDALPKEPTKPCNQLLNSILLQKCGLYINQPLARFDEANPLMKHLHDRKLLALMRRNYKIELPILEENLSNSTFLKRYIRSGASSNRLPSQSVHANVHRQPRDQPVTLTADSPSPAAISSSIIETKICAPLGSSLGCTTGSGSRMAETNHSSFGSPNLVSSNSSVGSVAGYSTQSHLNHHRGQERPRIMPRLSTQLSDVNLTMSPSNDAFFLEAFKNSSCSIEEIMTSYLDGQMRDDISLRHEAHMAEVLKRKGERKESHHYRRVLKSKANYSQSHGAIDQALKRVDSLGRLEHFCLTPLLFSPAWRSNLAPVRDHTIQSAPSYQRTQRNDSESTKSSLGQEDEQQMEQHQPQSQGCGGSLPAHEDEANERWHQMICNNYIKEYEQYIQTLGFNSVQIRYPSSSRLHTSSSSSGFGGSTQSQPKSSTASRKTSLQTPLPCQPRVSHKGGIAHARRDSSANSSTSNTFIPISSTSSSSQARTSPNAAVSGSNHNYNTGYLIKFLNSGCLVFKVGFCKPYVYSILYSIEGERFNNSNLKMNMTAFLDELDNIKVTLHLHSFTYDYHLRSMYSYISRRQANFNPGYHLISFVDDFRKYYQKSPNYARNHILSGEVSVTNLKVDGQQLYNYIVTHNTTYRLDVLEMTSSASVATLIANFNAASASMSTNNNNSDNHPRSASQQFASFLSASFSSNNNSKQSDHRQQQQQDSGLSGRYHANDYVLIELERERVRYKEGKDSDIFDCGLLIAHDLQQTRASKNCLVLKYFLILTNQRDLYPKLFHANDSIISLGCHRPIRLGLADYQVPSWANKLPTRKTTSVPRESSGTGVRARDRAQNTASSVTTNPIDSDAADLQFASELLSSGELSGPQSLISTVNSVHSSGSFRAASALDQSHRNHQNQLTEGAGGVSPVTRSDTEASVTSSVRVIAPSSLVESSDRSMIGTEEAAEALAIEDLPPLSQHDKGLAVAAAGSSRNSESRFNSIGFQQHSSSVSLATTNEDHAHEVSSIEGVSTNRDSSCSPTLLGDSNRASCKSARDEHQPQPQERTICDEEITYLGYFSSDEMDMLKFLQEKTTRLKVHLEQIVRRAEVHFRRDYLWHKLMQRQVPTDQSSSLMGGRSSGVTADQLPLSVEELIQLMAIVEAIDLDTLDANLHTFTTMHITWYMKLLKAFNELKQSAQGCTHRIYTVKASKFLLLFIDPKCTSAFVLLSIDSDRGSVGMSLILKDEQECFSGDAGGAASGSSLRSQRSGRAKSNQPGPPVGGDMNSASSPTALSDLDADCQQLISDFINFCATFMWSNLLT